MLHHSGKQQLKLYSVSLFFCVCIVLVYGLHESEIHNMDFMNLKYTVNNNKHVNKNFSSEITSYNAIQSDWLQRVNSNHKGAGVNTIMIKCVMFLQKGLNAEKIVV